MENKMCVELQKKICIYSKISIKRESLLLNGEKRKFKIKSNFYVKTKKYFF